MLRCPVEGISVMGRATQGVRVMKLASDEQLVALARLAEGDTEADSEEEADQEA